MKIIRNLILRILALMIVRPLIQVAQLKLKLKIKIVFFRADIQGYCSLNGDYFFRRIQLGLVDTKYYYILIAPSINDNVVANPQLLKLWKNAAASTQVSRLITNTIILSFMDITRNIFRKYIISNEMNFNYKRNFDLPFSFGKPSAHFSVDDMLQGNNLLTKMGVDIKRDKIVAIFARDNAYKNSISIRSNHHDYRDSDINTYIESIEYLIKKGYTVIRIGNSVNNAVDYSNSKFIDYSVSGKCSPLLDLYIIYLAEFVVGTPSGAIDPSVIFNTPLLCVNYAPFGFTPLREFDDLYIPKKVINTQTMIEVPFYDLVSNEYSCSNYDGEVMLNEYNLTYVDNTSVEILDAVVEMEQRVSSCCKQNQSENDIELIRRYYEEYLVLNKYSNLRTPVGMSWLRSNLHLYFNDV